MATSWQIGTSYHNRSSPFATTSNGQYGNWFPDGGRGSGGRTSTVVSRRALGSVASDQHHTLTPVTIQHVPVVNASAPDPRDKFTLFMAKSDSGRLAAMTDPRAAPLTIEESVKQTRRAVQTPENSPEPGTMAEFQSNTIGQKTGAFVAKPAQNRDVGVARPTIDTRDPRYSKSYGQHTNGSVTKEARKSFNRSPMMVAKTVNGAGDEQHAGLRDATPRAMPTMERSQTFSGRPTTPYELATMRKNDAITDSFHWPGPLVDSSPSTTAPNVDSQTLPSERGRHAGNYNASAATPAGNRAMYWLYGSRGRPGPVVATDYLFSRDALESQLSERQNGHLPSGMNSNRLYDVKPAADGVYSSRTADARQAAAACNSQAAAVNSWTALRPPDTPYINTVTVNASRSADVARVARAANDVGLASPRSAASAAIMAAEKRSILKKHCGYNVGTYRAAGNFFAEPHLPPLSATSRTASGRKRVTFNL